MIMWPVIGRLGYKKAEWGTSKDYSVVYWI